MEAPLPVLIKNYRSKYDAHPKVQDAARSFLEYLHQFGRDAPDSVTLRGIRRWIEPAFSLIHQRFQDKLSDRLRNALPDGITDFGTYYAELRATVLSEQIAALSRAIENLPETESVGDQIDNDHIIHDAVIETIESIFDEVGELQKAELHALADLVLQRPVAFLPHTGVIVAGFGKDELFPTLVSFEVYGMLRGQLRIHQTNDVDIDRGGKRAKVIPFAQKEMVERFLFGLDDGIERKIQDFCRTALPSIRERTMASLDMAEEDRALTEADMRQAEEIFLDDLRTTTFDAIRAESEREIEGMVEFMPKSEMARMAEALVNLTSIKRRVSRGMETVGGPIDCAVISRADGFVWVKRKHYFPSELNRRYFDRMRAQIPRSEEKEA